MVNIVVEIANVSTPGGNYPVICGGDAAQMLQRVWKTRWRQVAIIGDTNTSKLFSRQLAEVLVPMCETVLELSFAPGEQNKTRETKQMLEDQLLEARFDRGCCLVGVGGGIALDVTGYVASTFLRGVAHVNVATSLLAQVDAAVGGKTGVNTSHGKNLIGTFHQPKAVLIDTAALASLPEDELRFGLAEAIKHAVLADVALFEQFEAWAASLTGANTQVGMVPPVEILQRCVQIKADVVRQDEKENGYRQVLNFGHTVAHVLETASDHRIHHGEAVAVGMVIEARLAAQRHDFPADDLKRLERLVAAFGLPVQSDLPFSEVAALFGHDKKTRAGVVHCALPQRIGKMHEADGHWAVAVTHDELKQAWSMESRK